MPLEDPVVAYTALNATEAHLVAAMLADAGVPAEVGDDVSGAGAWWGVGDSAVHEPRVYVGRADVGRAGPVLAAFEARNREKLAAPAGDGEPVSVTCGECGATTEFPAEMRGRVERCPACRAYVDVGDDEAFDDWADGGPDSDDPSR